MNSALVTSGHQSGSSDSDEDIAPPSNRRHASLGVCLYRVATEELTPLNDAVIKATNVKAIPHQDVPNQSTNTYTGIVVSRNESRVNPSTSSSATNPPDDEEKVCNPSVPVVADHSGSMHLLPVARSVVPLANPRHVHKNTDVYNINKTTAGWIYKLASAYQLFTRNKWHFRFFLTRQ